MLRMYDTRARKYVCELQGHSLTKSKGKNAFNPIINLERYGQYSLFSCCSKELCFWDLRKGDVVHRIAPELSSGFLRAHIGVDAHEESKDSTIFCSTGSEVLAYSGQNGTY